MNFKTLLILVLIYAINGYDLKLDMNSIIESIEQDFSQIQNQYKTIINNLNICKNNLTLLNDELNLNDTLGLLNASNEMDPYNAAIFKSFEINIHILKLLQKTAPLATGSSIATNTAAPEGLVDLKKVLTDDMRSGFDNLKKQQDEKQELLLAAVKQMPKSSIDTEQQKEDQKITEVFENNLKEMQSLTSKLDQIQNTLQTHLQQSGN